jgi:hypothetical protein
MFNKTSQSLQAEYEAVCQALARLKAEETQLHNQQTRLHLMQQVQQQGVARQEYTGFQPKSRHTTI